MQQGDVFNLRFEVNEAAYNGFINLFNDRNPLHTDADFAISKGFAGKLMHGNILNGFVSYFIGEGLPMKDVIIQTQEIKFMLPVYLHDVLDFQAQIADYYESVNSYDIKFTFTNAMGKKVARGKVQIGRI